MDTEDKKLITKCLQQSFGFSLDEVTDNTKFYTIEVGNTETSKQYDDEIWHIKPVRL